MKTEKKHRVAKPSVVIDKSLEKYKKQVLFPEKLAKANEVLRRIGLPKLETR